MNPDVNLCSIILGLLSLAQSCWKNVDNIGKYWKNIDERANLKILENIDKFENIGKILTNLEILEKY